MLSKNSFVHHVPSFQEIQNLKASISNYNFCKNLVIIGMGGAILNPSATINALIGQNEQKSINAINVHFTHYIDSIFLKKIIKQLSVNQSFSNTVFLIISNSGYTSETIAMTEFFLQQLKSLDLEYSYFEKHFLFILGSNQISPLYKLATNIRAKILEYTKGVGGRFCSFASPTLIPMMLCKLDVGMFCKGARNGLLHIKKFTKRNYKNLSLNKNINNYNAGNNYLYTHGNQGKNIHNMRAYDSIAIYHHIYESAIYSLQQHSHVVYLNYISSLHWFYSWICQSIMETFGKSGCYPNVIQAIAPLYCHGQLENYLYTNNSKYHSKFHNNLEILHHLIHIIIPINEPILLSVARNTESIIKKNGHIVKMELMQDITPYKLGYMMISAIAAIIKAAKNNFIEPSSQPAIDDLKNTIYSSLYLS